MVEVLVEQESSTTFLVVNARIFERQNSNFEWVETNEGANEEERLRPLLHKIQQLGI